MRTHTKRLVSSLVALALTGLTFAAVAQAHTLSLDRAQEKLQKLANDRVKRSDGEYVKAQAQNCKRLYPHLVRCKAGYFTRSSLRANRFDCVETVDVKYRAHSEAGESRSVFFITVGHDC